MISKVDAKISDNIFYGKLFLCYCYDAIDLTLYMKWFIHKRYDMDEVIEHGNMQCWDYPTFCIQVQFIYLDIFCLSSIQVPNP